MVLPMFAQNYMLPVLVQRVLWVMIRYKLPYLKVSRVCLFGLLVGALTT